MQEKILSEGEEFKLDPKLKKEIGDVVEVIRQTTMDFHNYVFPKYINNYKKYLGFVAERLSHIEPWQSNINYPMVSSAVDTMFSNVFDFGYQIGVTEEALKKQCIRAFDFRNTGKRVLEEVTKEAIIIGKSYAKDYLIKEDFKEKFFGREIKKTIKMPSMQYISAFDIMYDRSKGLESSSYKIIRTFMSGDNIKKKVLPLIMSNYSKEQKEGAVKKFESILKRYQNTFGSRFSMYDYNPVKSLTASAQWFNSDNNNNATYYGLSMCTSRKDLLAGFGNESMQEDSKNYFLNSNKSTYEVLEYITCDKKYVFINGNIVYFGDKIYNLGEIREVTFSKIPGTGNAAGMADKLTPLQDLQNTLWNAFVDNLKLVLGPMFKVSGNLPIGKNGKLDFKAFQAFKVNGQNDIEKVQLGVTDFAPINFMQMNEGVAMKESGMNNYVTGGGGSIERTQAGVDVKFNQYKSKLTPLTDSIDQMMGNITRSWIFMLLKFYTKEELEKLEIGVEELFEPNEKGVEEFVTFMINGIDIMTIIDETNISFTYNSLDKITMESSRETIITNLQYMLQYIPGQINMEELGKILSGKSFNPEKLLKEKQIEPQAGIPQPQGFNGFQQQYQPKPEEQLPEEDTGGEDDLMQQLQGLI